jgi:hypothetical protein
MLQWLDTLIGLVVILLAASLIVMILTQIVTMLLSLRGYNLRNSISILLENLEPTLKDKAREISEKVLSHPLITDKWGEFKRWGLATSIRKEELTDILDLLIKSEVITTKPEEDDTNTETEDWKVPLENSLSKLKPKINIWFDRLMNRTSQAFIRQTRIWTIIFSVILAFVFHLDLISMFEQISTDPELRATLVITSESILNKADNLIGSTTTVPAVYVTAITELKKNDTSGESQKLSSPPSFNTREEGEEWIRIQLAGSVHSDSLIVLYRDIIDTIMVNSLNEMRNYARLIKSDLDQTGLKLVPQPYPGFLKYSFDKHFWGVLIMAAFLSLGAPFWFKALKTLSALRPILANKVDEEKKDTQKKL